MRVNLDEYEARQRGQLKRYHGANVTFSDELLPDPVATEKAGGIPKFTEIETITIQYPGMDRTSRRVEERDRVEYADLYRAFKENKTPPVEGTSLQEWSLMPRSVYEEFRHLGFKTIEQVATANEDVKRRLGPLQDWCKKAKAWLKPSEKNELVALQERADRAERRVEKLLEQVTLLMQRVEATEGTNLRESN